MAQSFNTSLKSVASNYLRLLHVNVTPSSVEKDIEENPHYPSLLSLSETFDRYRISNNAFKVTAENLDQVEPPFVAFVNMPSVGGDFVVVTDIGDKKVTYLYRSSIPQALSKELFLSRYREIVWAAEPDEQSGEAGFGQKLALEKAVRYKRNAWFGGVIALILLLIAANLDMAHAIAYSTIAFIKLAGTGTAVLLLLYESDKSNSFVKKICHAGKQSDCDAVLGSKAAVIVGINWAEIGWFYFAATTLGLLYPSVPFADKTAWLAIANALAAPYILFSLYYQWRVVKQWCPLCLVVQAVLFSELIWGVVNYWSSFPFSPSKAHVPAFPFLPAGICLLFPILSWYGLKRVLAKARDSGLHYTAYKRLQNNREIFHSLLQQQDKTPEGWQRIGISIGNPIAATTIIKVCSPYCGPCAKAHPHLEEIIHSHEDVHLKVIFTARNGEQDERTAVARHLLAIAAEGDSAKTRQALNDWYNAPEKVYGRFAAKYPMNGELKQQDAQIEAMAQWCAEAEIDHTPTIFVNGHRLPENYAIEELKNIL